MLTPNERKESAIKSIENKTDHIPNPFKPNQEIKMKTLKAFVNLSNKFEVIKSKNCFVFAFVGQALPRILFLQRCLRKS